MDDPLAALLVDENAVDRAALTAGIRDFVAVTSTGQLRPHPGWNSLSATSRVLVGLLGLKAARLLGTRADEAATPKELASATGIPEGTAKRELRELLAAHIAAQDAAGRYYVLGVNIARALDQVREGSRR